MRSWLIVSTVVGTTALAGALVTSSVVGRQVEQRFTQATTQWSSPSLHITLAHYDRGWLSARARTEWTLTSDDGVMVFSAHHIIHHAPWTLTQAASITTDFALPEGSDLNLRKALQQQVPLQVHSRIAWSGHSQHHLTAPAWQATFADTSTLDWGGLQGHWELSADHQRVQGSATLPRAHARAPDTSRMDAQDLHLQFDLQHTPGGLLWGGPMQARMGQLQWRDAQTGAQWQLHGLTLDTNTQVQGDNTAVTLRSSLRQALTHAAQLHDIDLTLHVRNVHTAWLHDFLLWSQGDWQDEQHRALLWASLPRLLTSGLEVEVQHLTLHTPEGASELQAKVRYARQDAEQLQLLNDLQAHFSLSLPKLLIQSWMGQRVRGDYEALLEQLAQPMTEEELRSAVRKGVDTRLQSLIDAGLVQEQAERFSAELDLQEGQTQLNGQPISLQHLLGIGSTI